MRQYKMSFIPIIPFLTTLRSNKISITNSIVKEHQIIYDFNYMLPNTYFEFRITINKGFNLGKAIVDFDPYKLSKSACKVKFKSIDVNEKIINKYNNVFEFALFKKRFFFM